MTNLNFDKALIDLLAKIPQEAEVLDLGCGLGRHSLFFARHGLAVTAIDKSQEFLDKLKAVALQENLTNLNLQCVNILDFQIMADQYFVINISDVLHFFPHEVAINILNNIKSNLKTGGYLVFSGLTAQDTFYTAGKGFLNVKDLQAVFFDWTVIFSDEKILFDQGHPGQPLPHQHHQANFIAQKLS